MAYTLEQLKQMGAKPVQSTSKDSYSFEELQKMGAKAVADSQAKSSAQQDGFFKSLVKAPVESLLVKPALRATQALATTGVFGKEAKTGALSYLDEGKLPDVDLGPIGTYRTEGVKPGIQGLKQVGGEALESAAFLAPYGKIAGAATKGISPLLSRAGVIQKVLPSAKTFGSMAAGGAGGYAFDVGSKLQAGEGIKESLRPGLGTAIGVAVPLAGAGIGKAYGKIKEFAKVSTPADRMKEMTRNLRTLQTKYDDGVKYKYEGGKKIEISNPIKTISDLKLIPKVENSKVDTTHIVDSLDEAIDAIAKPRTSGIVASKTVIDFNKFKNEVIKEVMESKELRTGGIVGPTRTKALNILQDFKQSFGNKIPLGVVDEIRVAMNKRYDPELRDAFRAIGNATRKIVYEADPASRPALMREGELLAAREFAEALNNRVVKGGRLGGYVSQVIGAIMGGATNLPFGVGPFIGAMGGKAVSRAVQRSYFEPFGGSVARGTVKAVEGIKGFGQSALSKEAPTIQESVEAAKTNPRGGFVSLGGKPTPAFQGSKDLTTKFLDYAKGKTTLSKQEILDFAKRPELKKGEADLLNAKAAEITGKSIPAQEFADSIRRDLLELKLVKVKDPQFENVTVNSRSAVPTRRGDVPSYIRAKNYEEVVFESPITTNGSSHYPNSKNYFAHARGDEVVEGGKKIWREQEIQSDALQKDNMERLVQRGQDFSNPQRNEIVKKNIEQLSPFTNDRFGERIMRERIKEKASKGYEKYRLPTGETIGKIEGFEAQSWNEGKSFWSSSPKKLTPENLKVGDEAYQIGARDQSDAWIITDILGDGRFKAVAKGRLDSAGKSISEKVRRGALDELLEADKGYILNSSETFDLTGKSNPQYRRYSDWGKFLKNKFGGKEVTDPQGNSWMEIDLKKEYRTQPILNFGGVKTNTAVGIGAGIAGATILPVLLDKMQSGAQQRFLEGIDDLVNKGDIDGALNALDRLGDRLGDKNLQEKIYDYIIRKATEMEFYKEQDEALKQNNKVSNFGG